MGISNFKNIFPPPHHFKSAVTPSRTSCSVFSYPNCINGFDQKTGFPLCYACGSSMGNLVFIGKISQILIHLVFSPQIVHHPVLLSHFTWIFSALYIVFQVKLFILNQRIYISGDWYKFAYIHIYLYFMP